MELRGAVVLVTGGAGGLGRVIAAELGQRAARPLLVDRDPSAGRTAVTELRTEGVDTDFLACDLTDLDAVAGLIDRAERFGRPVAVINNAGGWGPEPYPAAEPAVWRRTLDLNLTVPMMLTQLAVRRLPGAAVVNVGSSAALAPDDYGSPEYAVAKAGLVRLTGAVSGFAARYGVRVNCVLPHWIGLDRARREYAALTPARQAASGGLVEPGLVARTVVDLIADDTANGQVLALRADRAPYRVDPADADPGREPGHLGSDVTRARARPGRGRLT